MSEWSCWLLSQPGTGLVLGVRQTLLPNHPSTPPQVVLLFVVVLALYLRVYRTRQVSVTGELGTPALTTELELSPAVLFSPVTHALVRQP